MAFDKHYWYDCSKAKVRRIEEDGLRRVLDRRKHDKARDLSVPEYERILNQGVRSERNFTTRWLTNRVKQDPLGEDRKLRLTSRYPRRNT